MPCARRKRRSASGPPWSGGPPRTRRRTSSAGGASASGGRQRRRIRGPGRVVCPAHVPEVTDPRRAPARRRPPRPGARRSRSWRTTTPRGGSSCARSTRTPAGPRSSASRAPPGVGKSTLIGALTRVRRAAGRTVAVLSIDPSSPFTQGALLGDRIRLTEHFLDPGVFIRSMANRGALGGLSEAALQAALLMDAAGKDDVLLETVGVGQAEVDIIDHADTVVLVLMPGSGDSIQALKAGRDGDPGHHRRQQGRPPADRHDGPRDPRRPLAGARQRGWRVPIVKTEAVRGEGIEELLDASSTSTAPTSRRRARCPSAGAATCATRCWRSAPHRLRRRLEAALRGGPALPGAARRGRRAAARPGQRGDRDPRAAPDPRPSAARCPAGRARGRPTAAARGGGATPASPSTRATASGPDGQPRAVSAASTRPDARQASQAPRRTAPPRTAARRTSRPSPGGQGPPERGRQEHGDEHLRRADGQQEARGDLDVASAGERAREPLAARAPQQPRGAGTSERRNGAQRSSP